jgi:hypothetical protein
LQNAFLLMSYQIWEWLGSTTAYKAGPRLHPSFSISLMKVDKPL